MFRDKALSITSRMYSEHKRSELYFDAVKLTRCSGYKTAGSRRHAPRCFGRHALCANILSVSLMRNARRLAAVASVPAFRCERSLAADALLNAPAKFGSVASRITFGFVCHAAILDRVSIIRTPFLAMATRRYRFLPHRNGD